jgi:hypothetical protein
MSQDAKFFFNDFWDEKLEGLNISEDVDFYLAFKKLESSFVFNSFRKRFKLKIVPILDKKQLKEFINQ